MPEDGRVRPKHVAEKYTKDKYKNKNAGFRTVMTPIYGTNSFRAIYGLLNDALSSSDRKNRMVG
jgi:hypothetical protein